MFSRAAKSAVKTFGQRNYYGGEDKLKIKVIQAAEDISQTLSQFLKGKSMRDHLAFHDVTRFPCPTKNQCKSLSSEDDEELCHSVNNPQVHMLTAEKIQSQSIVGPSFNSRESGDCQDSFVTYLTSQEQDLEKTIPEFTTSELKFISEITDQDVSSENSGVQQLSVLEPPELRDSELVDVSRSLPAVKKLAVRNQQLVPVKIDELMRSGEISKQLTTSNSSISRNIRDGLSVRQALQNRTIWIEEPDRGKMSHDQEKQYSLFLPPTCPYEPEEKSVYVKCSVNPKTCQSEIEDTWKSPDDKRFILKLSPELQSAISACDDTTCRQYIRGFVTISGEIFTNYWSPSWTSMLDILCNQTVKTMFHPRLSILKDIFDNFRRYLLPSHDCIEPSRSSDYSSVKSSPPFILASLPCSSSSNKPCSSSLQPHPKKSSSQSCPYIPLVPHSHSLLSQTSLSSSNYQSVCPTSPPPPYTPPQSKCSTCSPCSSYPKSPLPELCLHPPSCHPCSSPPPHYSPASRHQPCSPIENTVRFSNCSKIINTYPPAQTKNIESTKHKISTYHYALLTNINVSTRTSFGKYISHCSRSSSLSSFSTSASCSSPSSGKCKSVDEICKEKEKSTCGGSSKCEPQVPNTSCSPPKEKCGKRAQDTKCTKMKDEKKCPASCLPKEKCLSPSPPPAPPFNHDSSKSVCVPPRFAVPPPCPPREEAQEICDEEPADTNVCPLLLSMPKPPCDPAPLCPCPPPPKLPPGPCPCYPTPREISSISSGSNPCPKSKPKYYCERKEDVYCPPDAAKQKCPKKTCKDNAKNKFKS